MLIRVLGGHTLADNALHTGQTGADLVFDQFAHGADAAVAEVVDIVNINADVDVLAVADALDAGATCVQGNQVTDHRCDVVLGQYRS